MYLCVRSDEATLAIAQAIRAEGVFRFDALKELAAVANLAQGAQSKAFELLDIFCSGMLGQYSIFYQQNG